MNKYIDELTELICDTVRTVFPNASLDDGYDVADEVIAKLPTIEVSEDCISRTEVLSIISDCQDINDKGKYNTLAEVFNKVLDAPSVVPSRADIHREKEQAYYLGYEDGSKAVLNKLTTEQSSMVGEWIKKMHNTRLQYRTEILKIG